MGLVDSVESEVLVERHLFALIDNDPGNEEPFARIPGNSAFLVHQDAVGCDAPMNTRGQCQPRLPLMQTQRATSHELEQSNLTDIP
ncbi:hypothetical protein [Streptomyces mirabilis]|uniref:hypothetical protein n=1 Tax=Streptomyces mirabilis TaxID=68239 RepID=UPI00331A926E